MIGSALCDQFRDTYARSSGANTDHPGARLTLKTHVRALRVRSRKTQHGASASRLYRHHQLVTPMRDARVTIQRDTNASWIVAQHRAIAGPAGLPYGDDEA